MTAGARPRSITPDLLRRAQQLIAEGMSQRAVAKKLSVSQAGLSVRLKKAEQAPRQVKPGATIQGDDATVVSDPSPDLTDIPALLRQRKLDPDDWDVVAVTVNEWDGYDGPLRQLKIQLRRKIASLFVFPASDVRQRPKPKRTPRLKSRTVAFLSDQHAPYHDEALHRASLSFLEEIQPDEVILGGDGGDYGTISKHRDNPAWSATAQDCVQGTYNLYADYRDRVENATIKKLRGNHDFRLESELLLRAERMYGIKPATRDSEEVAPALSLRRLLHLEELHIELVEVEGDGYEHAEVQIAPDLVARHGWLTGPKAAQAHAEALGCSTIVGHTHRQMKWSAPVYRGGRPHLLVGVEAGCMCDISGLGYTVRPKWTQGFATAEVWPDGAFHIDLATFTEGSLYWRGRRWK